MQISPLPGDFSITDLEDAAGGRGEAPPTVIIAVAPPPDVIVRGRGPGTAPDFSISPQVEAKDPGLRILRRKVRTERSTRDGEE